MYNIDDIKNTVIHGDSEAELKKIPDESIDCVIIDPPYNLLKHKLDRAFDRELIYKELYRVLKNNSFLVVFGSGLQLCKDIVMFNKIGFEVKENGVWVKPNRSSFLLPLPRQHELFYFLVKGNKGFNKCYIDVFQKCYCSNDFSALERVYNHLKIAVDTGKELDIIKLYIYEGVKTFKETFRKSGKLTSSGKEKNNYRKLQSIQMLKCGSLQTTVFYIGNEHYHYEHPTQKPLELMSRIVKLVSNEDDIILDCFAGSGSTLLGAIKNNRNYIGIEIDKEYYDICCNRIKEHQGLFAGV